MNKKIKNKFAIRVAVRVLFFMVAVSFFSTPVLAADTFTYKLLEQFPGFFNSGSSPSFPDLVSALYSFGIWTVGIAAFLMLVIGGFTYITSAGNTSSAGTAKKIIADALLGLTAALVAYLILYVVNPDLVNLNLNLIKVGVNSGGGTYSGGGASGEGGGELTCKDGKCSQIDVAVKNNSFGIESNLLKAVLVGGEGCSKKLSTDGFGSCGYSQALPKIRKWCGISGSNAESCQKVQNDVQLDVNCAAKLIKDNAKKCGLDARGAASCYNSGKANNCAKTTKNYCGRVENYYNSCK